VILPVNQNGLVVTMLPVTGYFMQQAIC